MREYTMTELNSTRAFPSNLIARVADLVADSCWSVRIWDNEDGTAGASAHPSEIGVVRNAIRIARNEASVAHIH
jgi:hypothetical protein